MKMNPKEMMTEVLDDPSERMGVEKARRRRALIEQNMAEDEIRTYDPSRSHLNMHPGYNEEE